MPQQRGASHSLSFAGLCKTSGLDPCPAYPLCLLPGASEPWPAVGCIFSGICVEIPPSACSPGAGRQPGAERGSRVNLVLPGKAGSAPWDACARGLSCCRGCRGPGALCRAGESPGERLGAPEPKVGGGNVPPGTPGLAPALHLKLKQISHGKGKFGRSGRSFCAWKPEVVLLWVRVEKTAPGRGKAPARSWSAGPVLLARAGPCWPARVRGHRVPLRRGIRVAPLAFWRAVTTAGCTDFVFPLIWIHLAHQVSCH